MTLGFAALHRTSAEAPGFLRDGGGTLCKTETIKRSRAPQPVGIFGAQQVLASVKFRNVRCWVF